MHRADVFVVFDDVQYDKHRRANRNRIKTPAAPVVDRSGAHSTAGTGPRTATSKSTTRRLAARKHLLSIQQNYAQASYFSQYIPLFEQIYSQPWERLLDLNMACLRAIAAALGIERPIRFSSELGVGGASAQRLIGICHAARSRPLLRRAAGRNYIDDRLFAAAGIEIEYQDYQHPVYSQLHGEFISHLSVIDLLFNCGPKSMELLVS